MLVFEIEVFETKSILIYHFGKVFVYNWLSFKIINISSVSKDH